MLMGPAGAGKTTIGLLLAQQLCWEFVDGDSLHPAANLAKMTAGVPLGDADRLPWLTAIRELMMARNREARDLLIACSALKKEYRDFMQTASLCRLVYLRVSPAILLQRLEQRGGHYMKPSMLASQLAALEEPYGEGLVVAAEQPPQQIASQIIHQLQLQSKCGGPAAGAD